FFLAVLAFFRRHDVDLPAGELGRQAHVLAAGADGLREVLGVDHDIHGVLVFVDHDGFNMRRRQRADDELGGVFRPQHDVYLFAAQFVADGGDARTAHADASADRIDTLVVGDDRDLGAHAGVSRRRLDLEQALFDFRHFVLKQLADEVGRRPGQDDLLAARGVIDLEHPGADTIADADIFLGDHFDTGKAGFDLAGPDDGIALVHALHGARHDAFAALEEVVQHLLALGVAYPLQDGLLGGLRADAAELFRLEGLFDIVADFDAGNDFLGIGIQLLLIRFLQAGVVGHDQPAAIAFVLAGIAVDRHTDVGVFLEALFHGRCQRAFKCAKNHLAGDVFFTRQGVNQ